MAVVLVLRYRVGSHDDLFDDSSDLTLALVAFARIGHFPAVPGVKAPAPLALFVAINVKSHLWLRRRISRGQSQIGRISVRDGQPDNIGNRDNSLAQIRIGGHLKVSVAGIVGADELARETVRGRLER